MSDVTIRFQGWGRSGWSEGPYGDANIPFITGELGSVSVNVGTGATVNVTGDKDLTITGALANVTTIAASGFTGDLSNMETLYVAKEFFNKTIKSKYLDSRIDNTYVNTSKKENYIFNSTINGIEDSDLIVLIGTNPRYEATILNLRIRKSYLKLHLCI